MLDLLIVSSSLKFYDALKQLLADTNFSVMRLCAGISEAQRVIMTENTDLVIINAPLTDGFGLELAQRIERDTGAGVLLFVKNDIYEQVAVKLENTSILTLSKPASPQLILQSLRVLASSSKRIKSYAEENKKLRRKMDEMKTVNRAKLLLMQQFSMSETEAHRYIEKRAMDAGTTKINIAESIIKSYAN